MNLKQLEVFLAIVEQGSFSAAARSALITQSTVSQHVAALEEELGVRLLERTRNGVTLTKAGAILEKHARQVAGDLRAAHEAIRRFRGLEASSLRVAASTVPGGYLVPEVLKQMCERDSELAVTLLQGLAERAKLAERLDARRLQVEATQAGFRLSDARYKGGVDSFLGLLDAQRSLYLAEQELIVVRLADAANRVTLYKVLGGGWQ